MRLTLAVMVGAIAIAITGPSFADTTLTIDRANKANE
jgi:hypothetical protein